MTDLVDAIDDAIKATRTEIIRWAGGPSNNGPFSEEAYRTNIHIQSALDILAMHLRAHLERLPHD